MRRDTWATVQRFKIQRGFLKISDSSQRKRGSTIVSSNPLIVGLAMCEGAGKKIGREGESLQIHRQTLLANCEWERAKKTEDIWG